MDQSGTLAKYIGLLQRDQPVQKLPLVRGRPFDSEGGGGWNFLEINILTLKMLEINNLTLTC